MTCSPDVTIFRCLRRLEKAGRVTYVGGGWYRIGDWGPRVQGMEAAIAAVMRADGYLTSASCAPTPDEA